MADHNNIKLFIAEDHPILREAFRIFFNEQTGIEVVGQAVDTEQTLSLSGKLQPDVILIGSTLRPANILALINNLCQQNPDSRIVVLSSNIDSTPAEKYLEAGASQAIVKGVFASDLLAIIEQAYFK